VEAPTWSFGAGFDVTMDGKVDFDPGLAYLSGRGTSTLVLDGHAVTVDPTGISGSWALRGVTTSWLSTSKPVTVTVMPGQYVLSSWDSTHGTVTVTPDGVFDFDPALAHLSGRGTSTLVLHGHAVTVDPTGISGLWGLRGLVGWKDTSKPVTVTAMPGQYVLSTWDSTHGTVTVTPDGVFDFDPALAHLSGRGTSTLVLHGHAVTVDPTRISGLWAIRGVAGWLDTSKPVTVTVMPGQYHFEAPDPGLEFVFTVTPAGTIDYDPSLTYLSGQGTSTLVISQSDSSAFSRQSDGRNRQLFNLIILALLTFVALAVWRARSAPTILAAIKTTSSGHVGDLVRACRIRVSGDRRGQRLGRRPVRRVRWRGLRSPLA
jgi:hypothetical protein